MKKLIYLLSASMLLGTVFSIQAAQESVIHNQKTMSLALASKAVWAAISECRNRGYSVAAVVVDRGGNMQAQLRDRFAGPHTTDTAYRKAWTANSFRQSTGDLAAMLEAKILPSQVANIDGALLVGGGLMIQAAGSVIGAIGVSGAPPGKSERDSIDGACAQAGLHAIDDELAFSE
jgi:uncharacterized protein GlcG (DUF336 family)